MDTIQPNKRRKRRTKKSTDGGKAWSIANVLSSEFDGLPFDGKWLDAIGQPELAHSWIIYGRSSSGKTTFNIQLAKYISKFERVIYNSLEEGLSKSMKAAYKRAGLTEGDKNVILIKESMKKLAERLEKPKSPNVVFIDSIRYTRMKWSDYQAFCKRFPGKIIVWVSHAKGKEPKGALAEDILYDSFVKIYVEGFRAFISSRFSEGGDASIDIWPEGAEKYWGELNN
ncbi:MAG: hypothetical protein JEZ14_07460 [Marinilabiliaceae bacterium]|nr:hypothetical protein [Marinilabiliaceae bacterium]